MWIRPSARSLTSGSPPIINAANQPAGALGRADTMILQDGTLNHGWQSGARFTAGVFLDDCAEKALEVSGFFLGQRTANNLAYRADAHFGKKDLERAGADANEALRLEPAHVRALGTRGMVSYERKLYPAALADFTEMNRIEPANGYALLLRGRTHGMQARPVPSGSSSWR